MSEEKNDSTPTPPALIPPPVRNNEADAVVQPSSEIQPEASAAGGQTTQSEIAAEQAESALDARDESAANASTGPAATEPAASDTPPATQPASSAEHDAAGATAVIPAAGAVGAAQQQPAYSQQQPGYAQQPAPQQPVQQQRVFTPPPVAPKKKGNRLFGALIAVLSVVLFLVVFAVVAAIIIAVGAPGQSVVTNLTAFLSSPVFFAPAIFFVIGFVLVVLLANRANWWAYILGSLFVAALVYFGTIAVGLLLSNVVALTPAQANAEFVESAANPFVIAGALVAREVSIWIGAAIAARGRRMKTRNLTAREEYERAAAEHRAEYERGFAPA